MADILHYDNTIWLLNADMKIYKIVIAWESHWWSNAYNAQNGVKKIIYKPIEW